MNRPIKSHICINNEWEFAFCNSVIHFSKFYSVKEPLLILFHFLEHKKNIDSGLSFHVVFHNPICPCLKILLNQGLKLACTILIGMDTCTHMLCHVQDWI